MLSPYSVSYSSDKYYRSYISCKKTPYQDWLDKNKPSVIFKYSEHYGDDVLHMYFEPSANLIYILGDFDYYSLNIIATFIIDNFTKKLTIDKIFCESDNYWPEIFINKSPSNGIGGISKYKQNIAFWTSQDITFDNAIKYFFGEDWYLIIPITRPFLHNAKELVKHYDDYFDRYKLASWGRTIGIFKLSDCMAAVIIQKYYRGWKVRMKYRYNPATSLCKYLLKQEYKKLI